MTLNATGTVRDPQPIDRLMAILKGITATPNTAIGDVWAKVLGVGNDPAQLWPALLSLDQVVNDVEDQLRNQAYFESGTALATLAQFRHLYFSRNLETNFASFAERYTKITERMPFVADMVSRLPIREKLLPEQDVRDLKEEITRLIDLIVNDASLTPSLSQLLVKLGLEMQEALRAYSVLGLTPVERAFGAAMVQVFYNPTIIVARAEKKDDSAVGGFMRIFRKFGEIVTIGNATTSLLKNAGEIWKALGM